MNKQRKTFKRELSFDEKNGHHYRAARRAQENKQLKREERKVRDLRHYDIDYIDEENMEAWE